MSEIDGRELGKIYKLALKDSEIYLYVFETEEVCELVLARANSVVVDVGLYNWKRFRYNKTRPATEEEAELFCKRRSWLRELERSL